MSKDSDDTHQKPVETETGDGEMSRSDWEALPVDPDVTTALGYDWNELDVITAWDNDEKAVVLPVDQELIREEAFIVVASDSVYDVVNKR